MTPAIKVTIKDYIFLPSKSTSMFSYLLWENRILIKSIKFLFPCPRCLCGLVFTHFYLKQILRHPHSVKMTIILLTFEVIETSLLGQQHQCFCLLTEFPLVHSSASYTQKNENWQSVSLGWWENVPKILVHRQRALEKQNEPQIFWTS